MSRKTFDVPGLLEALIETADSGSDLCKGFLRDFGGIPAARRKAASLARPRKRPRCIRCGLAKHVKMRRGRDKGTIEGSWICGNCSWEWGSPSCPIFKPGEVARCRSGQGRLTGEIVSVGAPIGHLMVLLDGARVCWPMIDCQPEAWFQYLDAPPQEIAP
jgi:ribosomal protein S27AE